MKKKWESRIIRGLCSIGLGFAEQSTEEVRECSVVNTTKCNGFMEERQWTVGELPDDNRRI
jgi:hypothetical protein